MPSHSSPPSAAASARACWPTCSGPNSDLWGFHPLRALRLSDSSDGRPAIIRTYLMGSPRPRLLDLRTGLAPSRTARREGAAGAPGRRPDGVAGATRRPCGGASRAWLVFVGREDHGHAGLAHVTTGLVLVTVVHDG